jgi:hypothetical protein
MDSHGHSCMVIQLGPLRSRWPLLYGHKIVTPCGPCMDSHGHSCMVIHWPPVGHMHSKSHFGMGVKNLEASQGLGSHSHMAVPLDHTGSNKSQPVYPLAILIVNPGWVQRGRM